MSSPPDISAAADRPSATAGSARSLLRTLGVLLALAAILFATLSIIGSLARDSRSVQAEFAGVAVVDVDVDAASIEVVAAADATAASDVRLERTISWSWRKPTFSQRQEGDRLVVRSSCPFSFGRGCGGTVRLVVPPATEVRAATSAGEVRASGLAGVLVLNSSAGSVEATGLRSPDVIATSSAGSVRLTFSVAATKVRADSSAGSVEVAVPRGTESYRVNANSGAGSTDVTVRTDPAAHRVLDVQSSAGSVRVGYAN